MVRKDERLYLNVVKGIAAFLMLWGHSIQYCTMDEFLFFEDIAFKFIYSFHMPLFMLVSGYLFYFSAEKRELKPLLIHRAMGILHPLVSMTVLYILLTRIPGSFKAGISYLELLDGEWIYHTNVFWFLWSVLACSTALAIGCKTAPYPKKQLGRILLAAVLLLFFPHMDRHLFMYPYFVAGFFLGKYKEKVAPVFNKYRVVSWVAYPVMLMYYQPKYMIDVTPVLAGNIPVSQAMVINLFRWCIGFLGCWFTMSLTAVVLSAVKSTPKRFSAIKGLSWLGANSLAVYCISLPLHSYYLPRAYGYVMTLAGGNLFAQNRMVYDFLFTPALTLGFCAGLYILIEGMKKANIYAFLFGR